MQPLNIKSLKRKHTAIELLTDPSIDTWTLEDRDTLLQPINSKDFKDRQEFMESGFNSNAYNSGSKATGRFQITPIAHKEYQNKTGNTGNLYDLNIMNKLEIDIWTNIFQIYKQLKKENIL